MSEAVPLDKNGDEIIKLDPLRHLVEINEKYGEFVTMSILSSVEITGNDGVKFEADTEGRIIHTKINKLPMKNAFQVDLIFFNQILEEYSHTTRVTAEELGQPMGTVVDYSAAIKYAGALVMALAGKDKSVNLATPKGMEARGAQMKVDNKMVPVITAFGVIGNNTIKSLVDGLKLLSRDMSSNKLRFHGTHQSAAEDVYLSLLPYLSKPDPRAEAKLEK